MRCPNPNRARPGTALVLFALVLFVLLGLAALVVDLGIATTTRRQMQAATEAAALEWLRDQNDATQTSEQRMANARGAADRVLAETPLRGSLQLANDAATWETTTDPPLPLLLGQGSLLRQDTRARGIKLRAMATAQGQRALAIGPPDSSVNLPGATPFALRRSFWTATSVASIYADGSLQVKDGTNDVAVGLVLVPDVIHLGQAVPALDSTQQQAYLATYQRHLPQGTFVTIYEDGSGPLMGRVVGFGFVDVAVDPADPLRARITRKPGQIATRNASAVLLQSLDSSLPLNELLNANQGLVAPLLAPVLVR